MPSSEIGSGEFVAVSGCAARLVPNAEAIAALTVGGVLVDLLLRRHHDDVRLREEALTIANLLQFVSGTAN